MIPMFPFSFNNTLKLFTNTNNNNMESIDEDAIKDRISQAVMQSLPSKRNIKFNAIIVLECDNDPKRTLVINENINGSVANQKIGTINITATNQKTEIINNNVPTQQMQLTAFPSNSFTAISSSDVTNSTNVLLSQPLFPATMEGLQALLNLTTSSFNRSNLSDGVMHNNVSIIPISAKSDVDYSVKAEKGVFSTESSFSSRKRKAEKPCRIPQDATSESHGLDLTLGGKYEEDFRLERFVPNNHVAIWPCPVGSEPRTCPQMILPRVKKPQQIVGHKKSSKIFNCNQCKLQFSSLNALCKHTFSDHRAFRCTFCSANFTQRSNLQRHSLKHVGFKPFICNVCSKAYYRKDHLVRHIEVSHPGSDPKSNITVKLSSSECLEYLEKMQNNKLLEISSLEEGNHFLKVEEKCSPLSENVGPAEVSPVTFALFDDARARSVDNDISESPENLQISFDEDHVKEESRVVEMVDYGEDLSERSHY